MQKTMFNFDTEVDQAVAQLRSTRPARSGTLVRLVGLRLEARGIMAPVGACCEVLGQAEVPILPGDTADTLAARVLAAEHGLYPSVLADFVTR